MIVRPAKPEDVPAVLPMVNRIGRLHERWDPAKYSFRDEPAKMYAGWLVGRCGDPRSVFLVAEREAEGNQPARVAGFLIGTVEREIGIYKLKEFGFVHDLWVEEQYRHEGTARQMVMLAVERFKEIGVAQVRLDVVVKNEPARQLFESCGFRASVVEMLMEL